MTSKQKGGDGCDNCTTAKNRELPSSLLVFKYNPRTSQDVRSHFRRMLLGKLKVRNNWRFLKSCSIVQKKKKHAYGSDRRNTFCRRCIGVTKPIITSFLHKQSRGEVKLRTRFVLRYDTPIGGRVPCQVWVQSRG